jgi:hypothetical protein
MPRLLAFLPCEKLIVNQEDNTTSLITVLESAQINVPRIPDEAPANIAVPLHWTVYSLWRKEDGDVGKRFEQRVRLILPDGQIRVDNTIGFEIGAIHQNHRVTLQVGGFPIIAASGECVLRLSLRESGQADWQDIADYPVYVDRIVNE